MKERKENKITHIQVGPSARKNNWNRLLGAAKLSSPIILEIVLGRPKYYFNGDEMLGN